MTEHDADSNSRSGSGGTGWLLGVVGVLIFYLLSPGPLVAVYGKSTMPPAWVIAYITPIAWCCKHSKPIEKYYGKYLELWRPR
ncbi:hypothetical protein [Verrucomicrobium sp. BvORR034]|uniref:hypothetical protein n=1 Tax=Verrucomicrobium sp. BvORR034 TaxID=1396418 RepID=UPI000679C458|nr:hypothetical protein [Verrucomicrobium sp. BvORR034]